jgi:hypothetical protein
MLESEQLTVEGSTVMELPTPPGVGVAARGVAARGVAVATVPTLGKALPKRPPLWPGLAPDVDLEPFVAKNPTATMAAMTRAPTRSIAGLIAVFAGAVPTGAAGGIAQAGAAGGGPTGGGGGATAGATAVGAVAATGKVKPQAAQNLCPASVRGAPQLGQKPNPVVIPDPSDLPFPRRDKASRAAHQNRLHPQLRHVPRHCSR